MSDPPIRQCIRRSGPARAPRYHLRGRAVTDPGEVKRLNALRVPPRYTDVCFNEDPRAPLQATARDTRGRLQYRYSEASIRHNASAKFRRLLRFAKLLPRLRGAPLPRVGGGGGGGAGGDEKRHMVAQAVRLLDQCHFRVGNPKYLKENRSYGLSNLEVGHASVGRGKGNISFPGKTGKRNTCEVTDPVTLAFLRKAIKRHNPKERLFGYTSRTGKRAEIRPIDINRFLQSFDAQISAKDFRTWQANVELLRQLAAVPAKERSARPERALRGALEAAAASLNNTPAVCKSNYIHPMVLELFRGDPAGFDRLMRPYTKLSASTRASHRTGTLETVLYRMLRQFHSDRD